MEIASIIKEAKARATEIAAAKASGAKTKGSSQWISLGASDYGTLNAAAFPLGEPVAKSNRAAVFEMPDEILPLLSQFMHEKFNRCGGFFSHRTRQEAERDLTGPSKAAGGPYTIDQQAWVKPLMSGVKEAELRSTIETMAAYNNRFYTADTGVAAARWLAGRWQSLAGKLPGAKVELVSHDGWAQPSVVLTIPGTENSDEIVVVGGHLDSINGWGSETARAPGADDNASGIAVVTEALRVLANAGFKPKRTVQFMGYAAEEVGLRGSADIASRYQQAGKKVVGVVQYDMTGYKGSPEEIFLLTDNVDADLTAFMGKLIDAYVGVQWSTTECGYACSDHASWTRSGYPSALPFEASFDGMNHALHTTSDTLGTIGGTAEHAVPFAKLAIAFASELAKTGAAGVSAAK
ncbi:MAG: M20/M25/M40 family metallo-hydrolase [Elusimicrobia bacterium]|nr:M20/M25/M40 family metallo-hydrolase [Elusimicrobiota bacterium]